MNLCPCCKQPVEGDGLFVSLDTNTASRKGVVVPLTPGQAEILATLALRYPRLVPYSDLMEARHGLTEEPNYGSLKVMAHGIRRRLALLGMNIIGVRNGGYRLEKAA